jgi:hypothetical protein
MLRLIGLLVVILLLAGPLLERAGLLPPGGVLASFVDVEERAFLELVAYIRIAFHGHTP